MEHIGGNAKQALASLVERIEKLNDEKRELQSDIKDIYVEAKDAGFHPAVLRLIVKIRGEDKATREEREALLDQYMHALGML